MKTPIVMAAFGTTSRALVTYSFIDESVRTHFPDHEILWSYSSRMVKDRIKKKKNIDLKHPHQVLTELKEKGYPWAVVQSMHLISGHEFYRLVEEAEQCGIRTAMGLPLLYSPEDYQGVMEVLLPDFPKSSGEAVVMVGHGTDHASWSSYLAFHHMVQEKFGPGIYMGMVEEGTPSMEEIVASVKKAGFKKVRLVPFMLVAGVHFQEDLTGDEDSWKTAFEQEQISVSAEKEGLGFRRGIIDIFCKHIQDALDVIPV
jgi:sirohydrochlorin cobaltochelatase